MSAPTLALAWRLRRRSALVAAASVALVIVGVGALYPAVGDSIGKLDLPEGVAGLLGGADYGTLTGWMRSEIGAVYGPLVVAAVAITTAVGLTAGEEESQVLGLVLAHPVTRTRLVVEKALGTAASVAVVSLGVLAGLVAGVAVAGGGIALGHLVALAVHLGFLGLAVGALALALAGVTGQRGVAVGGAAGFSVIAYLVNGFAPLVDAVGWAKYASPFYYYEGHDPLADGVDVAHLAVLAAAAVALTAIAVHGLRRRDLRG